MQIKLDMHVRNVTERERKQARVNKVILVQNINASFILYVICSKVQPLGIRNISLNHVMWVRSSQTLVLGNI